MYVLVTAKRYKTTIIELYILYSYLQNFSTGSDEVTRLDKLKTIKKLMQITKSYLQADNLQILRDFYYFLLIYKSTF